MEKRPIGIFDSGVGGLTVFKAIRNKIPGDEIIYFGDTARVPYGPKSDNTIKEFSLQNARFLLHHNVKIIIIACNTSSAIALDYLQSKISIPIIGVIEPGAATAVKSTKSSTIGIIGTEGTIRSKAYEQAILHLDKQARVFSKACPLLVSLAEEGWEKHITTKMIVEEYLRELIDKGIDTLVLGCTHYPILKEVIQKVVGEDIFLVDSAEAISEKLTDILNIHNAISAGENKFYVSDNEEKFKKIANRILNTNITSLVKVKLGESWYIE